MRSRSWERGGGGGSGRAAHKSPCCLFLSHIAVECQHDRDIGELLAAGLRYAMVTAQVDRSRLQDGSGGSRVGSTAARAC